ncbi:MFS general substrate transporter [Aureobasidium pullulans]|uniref:MFS general substrate transporter n=1 Tax=Aureobasidium pullulans TaxID=5580 RepID=A0A4S9XRV1_AURPU|nr:MFS general substrate transporter [Aureobasidium pullulans]THZ82792.1 MFS general substrate transporter [Aureobasidium pullulans]
MATIKDSLDEPVLIPSISPSVTDDELQGLSLYEQKCVLINREMDSNGMGRYQWSIWLLCGFGYFIDLLWAQAFGLVLRPLQQELGIPANQSGNISTAFSAGLTAGAFTWGVLVDIIGRRWAFNLTCLISAAFGLGLGGCDSYTCFLVVTAFCGFGIGGNIPIDTTICLEFLPQNRRFLLVLLSLFQPIGVVICSVIAYGFIPSYSCSPNFVEPNPAPSCRDVPTGAPCCTRASNMGWRYLMFTLGAITLSIFFLRFVVFNFQESPKFLVYRGKDQEAIEVLQTISKFNKRQSSLTMEDFRSLHVDGAVHSTAGLLGAGDEQETLSFWGKLKLEFSRYGMLFSSKSASYLTILVWLTYIMDFWGFTLAGGYLPSIIAAKNVVINRDLKHTYRSYVYIYLPGIVGVLLGGAMYKVPAIGRKWSMVISSALTGISIFLFSAANSNASNIGLNVMEYFFQSMFNAILYGWTPEQFPTAIRGTACGIAAFWGRLFGIVAPQIAQHLLPSTSKPTADDYAKVLYLAGGITLGCVVTTALLPNKMLNRQSM